MVMVMSLPGLPKSACSCMTRSARAATTIEARAVRTRNRFMLGDFAPAVD
jgi:hypothetical protein